MTKRGPDQKTLTKRRTLLFVDREVFDIHVVVGIDPRPSRMYAPSRYTTIHIFTITVSAKRPMVCGTSTLFSKKENIRTGVTYAYLICAPRTCISSKKGLIIFRA